IDQRATGAAILTRSLVTIRRLVCCVDAGEPTTATTLTATTGATDRGTGQSKAGNATRTHSRSGRRLGTDMPPPSAKRAPTSFDKGSSKSGTTINSPTEHRCLTKIL